MVRSSRRPSRGRSPGFRLQVVLFSLVSAVLFQAVALAEREDRDRAEAPVAEVDELGQAALQKAFRVLKANYIRPGELGHDAVNRAALDGLLRRLRSGAALVRESTDGGAGAGAAEGGTSTLLERLDGEIACLRLALADRVPEAAELADATVGAAWFLIDLRSPDGCGDFGAAARFLDRFASGGELLFRVAGPGDPRGAEFRSRGEGAAAGFPPVVLLVDRETSPAAEVVAGWFALRGAALVAGEPTAGRTVRLAGHPIAEGIRLRFADAEVVFPGGETLYGEGLRPGIPIPSRPEAKAAALRVAGEQGVAATISRRERPRLNEAALVAGIDPRLLVPRGAGGLPAGDAPQDAALRQLVDLLRGIDRLGLERPSPVDGQPHSGQEDG